MAYVKYILIFVLVKVNHQIIVRLRKIFVSNNCNIFRHYINPLFLRKLNKSTLKEGGIMYPVANCNML